MVEHPERETGADQAVYQFVPLRDAQTLVVQKRAAAAGGGVKIVARRIEDDAMRRDAFMEQPDGHAVLRKAVQKIGGALEGIDDPDVFRLAGRAAFLC